MTKRLKQSYDSLRASVRGFLDKARVSIHSGVDRLKTALNKLRFPVWYLVLLHVAAFFVFTEVVDVWVLWATMMCGFSVWGYKQINK